MPTLILTPKKKKTLILSPKSKPTLQMTPPPSVSPDKAPYIAFGPYNAQTPLSTPQFIFH